MLGKDTSAGEHQRQQQTSATPPEKSHYLPSIEGWLLLCLSPQLYAAV